VLAVVKTMKAVRIHTYGDANVLVYEDSPRPVPEAGEVLIRVHAAAINSIDCKIRAGCLQNWWNYALPLIPGWDFSGVIAALGDGVTQWQIGDAVYALIDFTRDGAYADYVIAEASEIAAKPAAISHVQAAAIPLVGLTAWQALLNVANLSAGQTILIHGAAGGVGSFAVQLAKLRNAQVIGTASSKFDFLHKLGIDHVIDYQSIRFEKAIQNVDVVLDTQGGSVQERSWQVLKSSGILVSVVSQPSREIAVTAGKRGAVVWVKPDVSQLTEIAQLIDAGQIQPIVETVLPLSEARRAHEQMQQRHRLGKIVLRVTD
jgi:NADPH:quinone reductase-like Zn-dependent oxidoreductase